MQDFHFHNPTDIHFGRDAVRALPALIGSRTDSVLLVFGSRSARRNGSFDAVSKALGEGGYRVFECGGNARATYAKVVQGVELCRANRVGCVIGIGGSACMDMAKIIAFGACHDDLWDYLSLAKDPAGQERLMVGTVPTYPAGGSEADAAAEVDDEEAGRHGSLYGVYPDFALLNPEFTFTLLPKRTAYAAAESFCQVAVNFFGGTSVFAERFTVAALDAIRQNAFTAMRRPDDYDARAALMWAATLGTSGMLHFGKEEGWAFSIYTEMDLITSVMDMHYREALTVLFPRWLEAHAARHAEEVRRFMVMAMGVDPSLPAEEAVARGARAVTDFFASLGLPMSYAAYGVVPSRRRLASLAQAFAPGSELEAPEIVEMYLRCCV